MDTIRKTNLEYARLVRDILGRHWLFRDHTIDTVDFQKDLASESNGLYIPTAKGYASPLQYICLTAITDICEFWRIHEPEYRAAIKDLAALKLTITWEPQPVQLYYFDTLVCPDLIPIFQIFPLPNVTTHIITGMHRNAGYLPLLEADADFPLIVLRPAIAGADSMEDAITQRDSGHHRDHPNQVTTDVTASFLNRAAKNNGGQRTLGEWRSLHKRSTIDLSKLFDQKMLRQLLDVDRTQRQPFTDRGLIELEELEGLTGERAVITGRSFGKMIGLIEGIFHNVIAGEWMAHEAGAEFFVESPELSGLIGELSSRSLAATFNLSEEQVAAWCMSTGDFQGIEIDEPTIVRFREEGGPSILRDVLREQRSAIRSMRPDGLQGTCGRFVDAIRLRLDAHADEIQRLMSIEESMRQNRVSKCFRLGTVTAFNFMLPSLLSTAVSLLVSSPTIKDLYEDGKKVAELQHQIEQAERHPLSIFERPLGHGRPIFRWPWVLN